MYFGFFRVYRHSSASVSSAHITLHSQWLELERSRVEPALGNVDAVWGRKQWIKVTKKTSVNRQQKQRGQNLGMHGYSTHRHTHPPTYWWMCAAGVSSRVSFKRIIAFAGLKAAAAETLVAAASPSLFPSLLFCDEIPLDAIKCAVESPPKLHNYRNSLSHTHTQTKGKKRHNPRRTAALHCGTDGVTAWCGVQWKWRGRSGSSALPLTAVRWWRRGEGTWGGGAKSLNAELLCGHHNGAASSCSAAIMEALAAQLGGCLQARPTPPSTPPLHHMTLAGELTPPPSRVANEAFFPTDCQVKLRGDESGGLFFLCFFFLWSPYWSPDVGVLTCTVSIMES